ncbi:MAG: hypothetical protein GY815_15435 [Gammaproteobacteria bacterium]|nr:hypothetical protein [Gammaproteobacteria bacterium]
MKLTFWEIECERDSSCYSIREQTKKAALQVLNDDGPSGYANVIDRVTIEYDNGFDMLQACTNEDGYYGLVIERKSFKI